jgi:hypothetical protein
VEREDQYLDLIIKKTGLNLTAVSTIIPEDGHIRLLWNVGIYLPHYMASHHIKKQSWCSLPKESYILHIVAVATPDTAASAWSNHIVLLWQWNWLTQAISQIVTPVTLDWKQTWQWWYLQCNHQLKQFHLHKLHMHPNCSYWTAWSVQWLPYSRKHRLSCDKQNLNSFFKFNMNFGVSMV